MLRAGNGFPYVSEPLGYDVETTGRAETFDFAELTVEMVAAPARGTVIARAPITLRCGEDVESPRRIPNRAKRIPPDIADHVIRVAIPIRTGKQVPLRRDFAKPTRGKATKVVFVDRPVDALLPRKHRGNAGVFVDAAHARVGRQMLTNEFVNGVVEVNFGVVVGQRSSYHHVIDGRAARSMDDVAQELRCGFEVRDVVLIHNDADRELGRRNPLRTEPGQHLDVMQDAFNEWLIGVVVVVSLMDLWSDGVKTKPDEGQFGVEQCPCLRFGKQAAIGEDALRQSGPMCAGSGWI